MNALATSARTLQTAEERREAVLEAATRHFARRGYYGTPTTDIARDAGISQAYLFRLFPTKKALFIAAVERGFATVHALFDEASAGLTGQAALDAMGESYGDYLDNRDLLLLQMQAYAASDDLDVRATARDGMGRLWTLAEERSGADVDTLKQFFAYGMLHNVTVALDLHRFDARWASECVSPNQLDPQ